MPLFFDKVTPSSNQIDDLYTLLQKRAFSISHLEKPSLSEHFNFVLNNPYLAWYLVHKDNNLIGSVYLKSDNSIGLNFIKPTKEDIFEVISFVKAKHKPLQGIKSVRSFDFFVNVSSGNLELIEILQKLDYKEIQRSFILKK